MSYLEDIVLTLQRYNEKLGHEKVLSKGGILRAPFDCTVEDLETWWEIDKEIDLTELQQLDDSQKELYVLNANDEKGIDYRKAISDAELITISIGGNNLLQPLINQFNFLILCFYQQTSLECSSISLVVIIKKILLKPVLNKYRFKSLI